MKEQLGGERGSDRRGKAGCDSRTRRGENEDWKVGGREGGREGTLNEKVWLRDGKVGGPCESVKERIE